MTPAGRTGDQPDPRPSPDDGRRSAPSSTTASALLPRCDAAIALAEEHQPDNGGAQEAVPHIRRVHRHPLGDETRTISAGAIAYAAQGGVYRLPAVPEG